MNQLYNNRVVNLVLACQLLFPESEFIPSQDVKKGDHMIKLNHTMMVQIGSLKEYYTVATWHPILGITSMSHDLKTPKNVFNHLQDLILAI